LETTDPTLDPAPQPERARLTFRRKQRLVRDADFTRVYRQGNRARGLLMTVAVLPNGTEVSRLGLSIGKRVWKKAVPRNRVRRVFREAFRLSYPDLPRGVDVVMIGSAPRIEPQLAATRQELERLVRKALARYEAKLAARAEEPAPGPGEAAG
jgi:ribonuclease P protein component